MSDYRKHVSIGMLGGGQLGRMFIQNAANYNVSVHVLDPDVQAPCRSLAASFIHADLHDEQAIRQLAQRADVLTIEIENVSAQTLAALQKEGMQVFPQPEIIQLIQDKRSQKQFYHDCQIPTASFRLTETLEDLYAHLDFLPFVQKKGKGGYDGRGVQKINTPEDIAKGFDVPSVIEKLVDIDKEIAIVAARNVHGEIRLYPPVEVVYHEQNLVDYLLSPARLSPEVLQQAERLTMRLMESLRIVGLLAVELFVTPAGEVLVNEVAPRPHNSGHHSIEASLTSQFDQHLRAILGMPLGPTDQRAPALMINLLGEPGHSGPVVYEGLEKVLSIPGCYVHLYGKVQTKPHRKMGHITLLGHSERELFEKMEMVRRHLRVVAE